jgi:hypothetical protein
MTMLSLELIIAGVLCSKQTTQSCTVEGSALQFEPYHDWMLISAYMAVLMRLNSSVTINQSLSSYQCPLGVAGPLDTA